MRKLFELFYGFLSESAAAITTGVFAAMNAAGQAGAAAEGYELASDEQTAAIAKQMGVDPSTIQVVRAPKGSPAALQAQAQGEQTVKTRFGTLVPYKDVPRGPDGQPDPAWVDDNCDCEEHRAKREGQPAPHNKAMTNGYI